MKNVSPVLGFNNNVKHKGRVFHIQTEDSGVKHPHIITHLFADGGRILKTKKTSYAEHLGEEELAKLVRKMMQEQHKAMFIALRAGRFDALIDPEAAKAEAEAKAKAAEEEAAAPAESQPDAEPKDDDATSEREAAAAKHRVERAKTETAVPASHRATEQAMATPTARKAPSGTRRGAPPPPPSRPGASDGERAPASFSAPPISAPPPSGRGRPSEPGIELDLDALDRASKEARPSFVRESQPDLPPPPAAVLGGRKRPSGTGSYRSVTPSTSYASHATPKSASAKRPAADESPGRYAPSRPASIFGAARPSEGSSIFGEDLISEKSLDEVILGYLADDLESPPTSSSKPRSDKKNR